MGLLRQDIDHCTTLRLAIQDLINQGSISLGLRSVTSNPLSTHSTHMVPFPISVIYFIDLIEGNDNIQMLSQGP